MITEIINVKTEKEFNKYCDNCNINNGCGSQNEIFEICSKYPVKIAIEKILANNRKLKLEKLLK